MVCIAKRDARVTCHTYTPYPTMYNGLTENAGHEIAGQNSVRPHYITMKCVVVCCYFLRRKLYNALFIR